MDSHAPEAFVHDVRRRERMRSFVVIEPHLHHYRNRVTTTRARRRSRVDAHVTNPGQTQREPERIDPDAKAEQVQFQSFLGRQRQSGDSEQ